MNLRGAIAIQREIIVAAPRASAFATFVDMTVWWPLATHTIGEAPARASVVEPRIGGRWYGIGADGTEHTIGHVVAYEPPERVVLTWEIAPDWTSDLAQRTEIDVRFSEESPTRTRVHFEHRGLEVYGELAESQRQVYEADDAWTYVLARFAAALEGSAAGAHVGQSPAGS